MFSTLIITDCGRSARRLPLIVSLKATTSFPASSFDFDENPHPVGDSWAAKDTSALQGVLELSLIERISEGRIGVTYSARVVSVTYDRSSVANALPEIVCLKFAKKQYSRSLAREAWFYEQLACCQGTSVPRCYGFFNSTFDEQDNTPDDFLPWSELKHPHNSERQDSCLTPVSVDSQDWLPDDVPLEHYWDHRGFKHNSPWNTWIFSEENPTISVLVLEKLGECCSEHWEEWTEPREGLREDLIAVAEDVGAAGLLHTDITSFNFLYFRGAKTADVRCPHHGVIHDWRVIDFDRSRLVDIVNGDPQIKQFPKDMNVMDIGCRAVFWAIGYTIDT
ncbi:hypothetical protein NLJ89_g5050 [Agrocybe chaxingu]|uniref:Uncharacterized protein n=1 Tax=Agrocybe chaxingu TaxID=84603 RepID=A0A9W8JZB0_9AGAR|nr:hypothetical protein NLJ89_g5050 [Agrocybe chaxingu]